MPTKETKLAYGLSWSFLNTGINALYGFLAVPLLLNYFGKSNYGLISLAMSVNVYLSLLDMGMASTNIRFFANYFAKGALNKVSDLFGTCLSFYGTIGLINAAILLIVSIFSSSIFNVDETQAETLRNLIYILSINAVFAWYTSCFGQLVQADEHVDYFYKISVYGKLLLCVILACTIYLKFSITFYFVLTTFGNLILTSLFYIYKIKKVICPSLSFRPKFDYQIFKEILPYSLNIFAINIFQYSSNYLRPIVLGALGTVEAVADFKIINGINSLVIAVGGVFYTVVFPTISKLVSRNDNMKLTEISYKGTRLVSIFVSFICFGLVSISDTLLELYVGKDYLYLVPWLDFLVLLGLGSHNQIISAIIFSGTNFKSVTHFTMLSCIGSIIACFLMVPVIGIGGVVISSFCYSAMQLSFYYLYYWPKKLRLNSFSIFTRDFLPFALIGALCAFTCKNHLPVLSNLYITGTLKGVIFVCSYILLVYISLPKSDIQYYIALLKNK